MTNEPKPTPDKRDDAEPSARAKRPYHRPAILYREPIELVAAVCSPPGKSNLGACPTGPVSS